jgi:hypothetical protein
MARPPLDPDKDTAGRAPRVGVRLPEHQHERLRAVIRQQHLTVSEFIRSATEAELARLELEAATGPPG